MKSTQQITERAMNLFYQQGFHATGVDQLSKEAQITKKTLYRHFPTKDALIHAALQHRHEFFLTKMKDYLGKRPLGQRPLAYIDFIIEWTQEVDFNGCAFINTAAEYPNHADVAHSLAAEHKRQIRTYLQQICTDTAMKNPQDCSWQLFLIGEALTVTAQVSGMNEELAELSRNMAKACLR